MASGLAMALILVSGILGQGSPPAALENIALGKPYTLEPAPKYPHCTDPGDATQLTDGVYTKLYFWTEQSTVGWQNAKPAVVTVDLGEVRPIRGVSFNTAAGTAGVAWPLSITIFVADEPGKFHEVGELVALSASHGQPKPDAYSIHRYWTDGLQTHGRYVAFAAVNQPFCFVDEVEVYAGDPAWLANPLPGEAFAGVREACKTGAVETALRRRLRDDATELRNRVAESGVAAETRQGLLERLDGLVAEAGTIPLSAGEDFRAVLPLSPFHQRIFDAQAARWRAIGLAPLTVWQTHLWDPLPHLADPDKTKPAAIDVALMQNEYRSAVLNLSNAGEGPVTLTVRFEGLPESPTPGYAAVREVAWTDTNRGVPVASALPDAERGDNGWRIGIPAGMTRQVWLTFHPTATDAGVYEGRVVVEGAGEPQSVPVKLRIYPVRFPDQPTLHFGGWDYTDADAMYQVTPQNRDALIAMLKEYWVDSPWGTREVLPIGTYDTTGAMTQPPDTTRFDTWIARWPDARQYLVFPGVGAHIHSLPAGTPEFDKAVGEWMRFWAGHMKARNIEPSRFAILLIDEPYDAELQALIVKWAKAVRAANTGIRIWEDPTFKAAGEADPNLLEVSDVLCPNRQIFVAAAQDYRDLFVNFRTGGKTLEFYSCSGPVQSLDPYSYHLLQAWDCRRYGATATYFWAFGDTGEASAWNEYAAERSGYSPLFLDATSVTRGKHMEACREGIEDYEYFVLLEQAAARKRESEGETAAVKQAEKLLKELPEGVTEAAREHGFDWKGDLDRTASEQARREILEALSALQ